VGVSLSAERWLEMTGLIIVAVIQRDRQGRQRARGTLFVAPWSSTSGSTLIVAVISCSFDFLHLVGPLGRSAWSASPVGARAGVPVKATGTRSPPARER